MTIMDAPGSATLNVTIMRREGILAELETTLLKAQGLARRDRPLADLPVVRNVADLSISPADPHPTALGGID